MPVFIAKEKQLPQPKPQGRPLPAILPDSEVSLVYPVPVSGGGTDSGAGQWGTIIVDSVVDLAQSALAAANTAAQRAVAFESDLMQRVLGIMSPQAAQNLLFADVCEDDEDCVDLANTGGAYGQMNPLGMVAETPWMRDTRWQRPEDDCRQECCPIGLRVSLYFFKNWCCECPDSDDPTPTPMAATLGAVTATPEKTATQVLPTLSVETPTPEASATPMGPSGTCPTASLFGCYPNTTDPIFAAWIPGTHPDNTAADFVPDGSRASAANLDWQNNFPREQRTVHAVVGGEVLTNLYGVNDGNYRIRTERITHIGGNTYNICYEYLHLEPIEGSPATGDIVSAGTPLGVIESWSNDSELLLDPNRGPSHVHVAIYPCSPTDPLMNLAAGQGNQLNPLNELSFIGGSSE